MNQKIELKPTFNFNERGLIHMPIVTHENYKRFSQSQQPVLPFTDKKIERKPS